MRKFSFKIKIFYILYFLLFTREIIISGTTINSLIPMQFTDIISDCCLMLFTCGAILYLIFLIKFNILEMFFFFLIMFFFFISAYISGSYLLFEGMMLILCSKNLKFDEFNKFNLKTITITFFIILVLSCTGIIDMFIEVRPDDFTKTRYSLGFAHPNTLGILSFEWICEYIYMKRKQNQNGKYIISALIIFFIYLITDCRTQLIAGALLIIACLIYEKILLTGFKFSKKTIYHIFVFCFVLIFYISFKIVRYYWENPQKLQNGTIRSRIRLAMDYIDAYGCTLFGSHINLGSRTSIPGYSLGYYFLDNAYVRILVNYGIVVTLFVFFFYMTYYKKIVKKNEWVPVIISLVYLFYGLMEFLIFKICFNVFFIYMGTILYQKKKIKNIIGGNL